MYLQYDDFWTVCFSDWKSSVLRIIEVLVKKTFCVSTERQRVILWLGVGHPIELGRNTAIALKSFTPLQVGGGVLVLGGMLPCITPRET